RLDPRRRAVDRVRRPRLGRRARPPARSRHAARRSRTLGRPAVAARPQPRLLVARTALARGRDRTTRSDAPRAARRAGLAAVAARGCAEFWSLDTREAKRGIELGRDVLDRAGFTPIGFTPPGWLASATTLDVLTDLGYRYTTTRSAVLDLFSGAAHRVPALSQ